VPGTVVGTGVLEHNAVICRGTNVGAHLLECRKPWARQP